MVIGLVATGVFGALPLVLTGPLAFVVLRGALRPGRRDLRPGRARLPDRCDAARAPRRGVRAVRRGPDGRPAAGSVDRRPSGHRCFGGIGFVFVFSAVTAVIAAVGIALRVRRGIGRAADASRGRRSDQTEFRLDSPYVEGRPRPRPARATAPGSRVSGAPDAPPQPRPDRGARSSTSGATFGGGTYEVIWSLFLQGLGADLALIGLTFAMFGLPVLLFSPFAGRLVDRARPARVHRGRDGPARA